MELVVFYIQRKFLGVTTTAPECKRVYFVVKWTHKKGDILPHFSLTVHHGYSDNNCLKLL